MRAALYERQGPAGEVIHVEEVPRPEPGPGEVRVRLRFSGVNPTDWKSRSGATPRAMEAFQIPHHDGAGTIDEVGPGVEQSRIGERVWVWMAAAGRQGGTAAEWTVVPERQAIHLPDEASFELGASLGVPAITAQRCLLSDGDIRERSVLVAGGAGAVGHFAIELARFHGARVATTVSGPAKAELARAAGADLVVNYRDPEAPEQLRAFASQMDRVVEVDLAENFALDLQLSAPGTVISIYAADGPNPELPIRACMTANVLLRFILLYMVPGPQLDEAAADIAQALEAGSLSPLPVQTFPLDQCAAAQDAVEEGAVGKVLLEIL